MKHVYYAVMRYSKWVAPRRGAWIETFRSYEKVKEESSRTPQGCVD